MSIVEVSSDASQHVRAPADERTRLKLLVLHLFYSQLGLGNSKGGAQVTLCRIAAINENEPKRMIVRPLQWVSGVAQHGTQVTMKLAV